MSSVALRPLAIPNEHGGWGFLLEPVVLALAIAPSRAGSALAIALIAAFFLRHPLRLAARDLMLRKRYPRTMACANLALVYGSAAALCFAIAVSWSSAAIAVPFLLAAPFLAVQFSYDVRNRGRELTAELCGAIAAAAGGAACVLAASGGTLTAVVVATLAVSRSVPSILYVRSLLRGSAAMPAMLAHVLATIGAFIVAPIAIVVPVALLIRCAAARFRGALTAKRVGMEEVGWGVIATTAWAMVLTSLA
jgi:hypothetical protein